MENKIAQDLIAQENSEEKNERHKIDLAIINGAQDFQGGEAYTTVAFKEFEQRGISMDYEDHVYLISSTKLFVPFAKGVPFNNNLIATRNPLPQVFRWQREDVENFLDDGQSPSLVAIFSGIKSEVEKYMEFGNPAWSDFIALWVLGTYFHRIFFSYPYIHLNGNPGSGKTKCLSFIANLAFNGELSVNNTPAYMIRLIHDNSSTCCLDEVEKLERIKDEESKTLLAMLNAGYKRGTFVGKMEPARNGNGWKRIRYEAYSPKVLAGIKNLPATLASRCIPIIMLRSSNKEVVNNEFDDLAPQWHKIRNQLYRAMLTHYGQVAKSYEEVKETEIAGRSWELWRPILALATAVGGSTLDAVRALAIQVEAIKKDIETDNVITPVILKILYDLMVGHGDVVAFYSTQTLYERFASSEPEEFGWLKDEKKQGIRGKWLTKQLRIAGVITGAAVQKKEHGTNSKGYVIELAVIKELLKSHNIIPDVPDEDNKPSPSLDELAASIPF